MELEIEELKILILSLNEKLKKVTDNELEKNKLSERIDKLNNQLKSKRQVEINSIFKDTYTTIEDNLTILNNDLEEDSNPIDYRSVYYY